MTQRVLSVAAAALLLASCAASAPVKLELPQGLDCSQSPMAGKMAIGEMSASNATPPAPPAQPMDTLIPPDPHTLAFRRDAAIFYAGPDIDTEALRAPLQSGLEQAGLAGRESAIPIGVDMKRASNSDTTWLTAKYSFKDAEGKWRFKKIVSTVLGAPSGDKNAQAARSNAQKFLTWVCAAPGSPEAQD